jgi:hypothetical protein
LAYALFTSSIIQRRHWINGHINIFRTNTTERYGNPTKMPIRRCSQNLSELFLWRARISSNRIRTEIISYIRMRDHGQRRTLNKTWPTPQSAVALFIAIRQFQPSLQSWRWRQYIPPKRNQNTEQRKSPENHHLYSLYCFLQCKQTSHTWTGIWWFPLLHRSQDMLAVSREFFIRQVRMLTPL